jgi:Cu/Ag efflux pump CusA
MGFIAFGGQFGTVVEARIALHLTVGTSLGALFKLLVRHLMFFPTSLHTGHSR